MYVVASCRIRSFFYLSPRKMTFYNLSTHKPSGPKPERDFFFEHDKDKNMVENER